MDEQAQILGSLVKAIALIEKCREFSLLVPEVRVNLVYALSNANKVSDIAAVDGRITVVNGYPKASGCLDLEPQITWLELYWRLESTGLK